MRRPPAALHTRWLLAFGTAAVLVVAAVTSVGVTTASFTDRVTSTAELGAATLPAPEDVIATLAGDLESVSVTWDSAPGDFADSWDVARLEGACSGWTPPAGGTVTSDVTAPYEDNVAPEHGDGVMRDGTTYCYAARGTYGNWTSDYGAISAGAEVRVPAINQLYLTGTGSPLTLRSTPGVGENDFGCLLAALGVCTLPRPTSYTFESTHDSFDVTSNLGWHASLRLNNTLAVQVGTVTLTVHAWYASGACGSPPSGGRLIASGSQGIAVALLGQNLVHDIPLTPNPSFEPPATAQTLCMRAHSTIPSGLGLVFWYDIVNGAQTYLEGRFEP